MRTTTISPPTNISFLITTCMRWVSRRGGCYINLFLCLASYVFFSFPPSLSWYVYSSIFFVCAAVALCYHPHQVRSSVKTTTTTATTTTTKTTNFSRAPQHRRPLDTERLRRFAPNSAYCTGDLLVLVHTPYYRTNVVRGTSWYQPERRTSWCQPEIPVPA